MVYVIKRILATIPVMVVVALFVFCIIRLGPGDPASVIAGDYATAEDIQEIRIKLGLADPIPVQMGKWFVQLASGDLGKSYHSNMQVTKLISQRIEPTLLLAATTIILTILFVMIFSVAGFSVPVFGLGYILVYIFAMELRWLPVQGYRSPFDDSFLQFVKHITMPAVTLSVIYIALISRMTRASVVEVLNEDYVRTARAKGQSEFKILLRHALPNAAVPIVTVLGISIALMIGGVVVTESVYNIPGLGRLVLDAVLSRDYGVIQGLILFFSFIYIFINLLIDLSYTLIDPRIRY